MEAGRSSFTSCFVRAARANRGIAGEFSTKATFNYSAIFFVNRSSLANGY